MASKKNGSDRTGLMLKRLTREQVEERAKQHASERKSYDELKAKKAEHVTKWNKELRIHDTEMSRLAEEVDTGKAWVSTQEELFKPPADLSAPDRSAVDGAEPAPKGKAGKKKRVKQARKGHLELV